MTAAASWANRARTHYREYRPAEYRAIPNKETFFRELGQTAAAQIDTIYQQLRRPQLAEDPIAAMAAEESILPLIYPEPEPGHEAGWESEVVSDEDYDLLVQRNHPPQPPMNPPRR